MRGHTHSELRYKGDIVGPDMVFRASVFLGIEDLSGKRLELAQGLAAETTHQLLFNAGDIAGVLDASCYVIVDGITYIVDHPPLDPRMPQPGVWAEVLCHVVNGGKQPDSIVYALDGGTF